MKPFQTSPMRWALVLGILSVLSGLGAHLIRDDGLTLGGPPSALAHPDFRDASLAEAQELWEKAQALFVDARAHDEYAQSHIPGALSLPENDEAALADFFVQVPPVQPILIYCGGGACRASKHVAESLKEVGFADIRIFNGGWPEWVKAGLPQEPGS